MEPLLSQTPEQKRFDHKWLRNSSRKSLGQSTNQCLETHRELGSVDEFQKYIRMGSNESY